MGIVRPIGMLSPNGDDSLGSSCYIVSVRSVKRTAYFLFIDLPLAGLRP